ncbi:MAG: carboxypeptidase-like regulatory domain-containing protein [Acidobacteriota bacterium]
MTNGSMVLSPVLPAGLEERRLSIPDDGVLTPRLPVPSSWRLAAEVPGWWSPTKTVTLRTGDEKLARRLVLRPATRTVGKLVVEDGESLPTELTIRMLPVDGLSGSTECAVVETGRFDCAIPAGRLDLALHADGFVPHYRWQAEARVDEVLDLETLSLKRGASLAGWVETETRVEDTPISVRLAPRVAPSTQGRPNRVRDATLEVVADRRGFFQLAGITAGSYSLEAEGPERTTATLGPIEVWPDSETLLREPLVLQPPTDLELSISPRVDPRGEPWRARVYRLSDFGEIAEQASFDGSATKNGRVTVSDQHPGRFFVTLLDASGNAVWSDFGVELTGPDDAVKEIDLTLINIVGELRLGDEPIEATLYFGRKHGALSVEMNADEEGAFSGTLPRSGRWTVQVEAPKQSIETFTSTEVEPDAEGEATVSLTLPDTYLHGRVTHESGEPASDARVSVLGVAGQISTRSENDGSFAFRALPADSIAIRATGRDRTSCSPQTVDVLEDVPTGPIELVLRDAMPVSGRVLSHRGPVAGATVTIAPLGGARGDTVQTGLDGTFRALVSSDADRAGVTVSPPGFPLKAFDMAIEPTPVALYVSDEGGTLEVALPDNPEGRVLTVWQDGVLLPTGALVRWAMGHGIPPRYDARLLIYPRMAQGTYRACLGHAEVLEPSEVESWTDRSTCASGFLGLGDVLSLSLR